MASTIEGAFLKAIEESPGDVATHLAYADWLEEQGRPYEAMQQRACAGVSEPRYRVRRKSDGLFGERRKKGVEWSATGTDWKNLAHLKAHILQRTSRGMYGDTPYSDLEVVVFEVRVQQITALPVSLGQNKWKGQTVVVEEPKGGLA